MAEELENVLDKGESPPDDNLLNEGVPAASPPAADEGAAVNQGDNLQDQQIDVDEKGVSWEEREKELQRHETRARELREKLAARGNQSNTPTQYDNMYSQQYEMPQIPPVAPQAPIQPQIPQQPAGITQDQDFDFGDIPEDAGPAWYAKKFAEISRKAAVKASIEAVNNTIYQREAATRVMSNYPDLANQNSPLFKRTAQVLQQYGNDPRYLEAAAAQAAQEWGILPVKFSKPAAQQSKQPVNLRVSKPSITETGVKKEAPKGPQLSEFQLKVAKLTGRDPKNIVKFKREVVR